MEQTTCKECRYFTQHYSIDEEKCIWVNCGHCSRRRLKTKASLSRSCADFERREKKGDTPITKKYITKELLRYFLSLELPPDIIGEPPDEG